jgi:2-C-methyl-D-erythritol 4-phosphate cytidylyltransferase
MSAEAGAPRCWAIIPAAGRGRRMASARPKQYLPLAGATVIEHAVRPFLTLPRIAGVVVALAADDARWSDLKISKNTLIQRVTGGAERMHSVLNGLQALHSRAEPSDWVLVHDAVRPCLGRGDLERLLDTLSNDPVGGLLALPLTDTLKRADPAGERSSATLDRRGLWRALTPQMFRFGLLRDAVTQALAQGRALTDEAAAVEAAGRPPRLIEGSPFNIKITRAEDLQLAEAILSNASNDMRWSQTSRTTHE